MRRGLIWCLVAVIGIVVVAFGATIAAGRSPLLGLDLKGGVSVVLQPQGTANSSELDEAVSIIERRVNGLGVANSNVARQGGDVVINLPGIKDAQGALKVLGETATLYFRPVYCLIPAFAAAPATTPTTAPSVNHHRATTPSTTAKALGPPAAPIRLTSDVVASDVAASDVAASDVAASDVVASDVAAAGSSPTTVPTPATTIVPAEQGTPVPVGSNFVPSANDCSASNAAQLPTTPVARDTKNATVILPYYDNTVRYILGPADMTGNGVSHAAVVLTSAGQYQVNLTFTNAGSVQFDKIASQRYPYYQQNPSNPPPQALEAFELDGVVESAPAIEAPTFNGTAVISGSTAQPFTSKQASDLALVLNYGSLPVRFTPQSVQTVSATIGKDSLRAGLLAGIGGVILVLIYMIGYYRILGLIVVLGLALEGALLFAIITQLSQSSSLALTLSGVVGLIVAIGITVDSYVVYFERLKDEVRSGRTIRQSVDRSFARAFRTVVTADTVAFMAALILYLLTVGDVKGFAFMLGLSTLLDIVFAYFFIRPATILAGRNPRLLEARFIGVSRGLGARQVASEV
jgi:preprotein translocase subunit SecD